MKSLQEVKQTIKKYQDSIEERRSFEGDELSFKDCSNLRHICATIYASNTSDVETLRYVIPILREAAKNLRDIVRVPYAVKAFNFLIKLDINFYKLANSEFDYDLGYSDIYDSLACRNIYVYDNCEDIIHELEKVLPKDLIEEILAESKAEWHSHLKRDPVELTDEFLKNIDEVQLAVEKKVRANPNLSRWKLIKEELALRGIHWNSPAVLNEGALFDY